MPPEEEFQWMKCGNSWERIYNKKHETPFRTLPLFPCADGLTRLVHLPHLRETLEEPLDAIYPLVALSPPVGRYGLYLPGICSELRCLASLGHLPDFLPLLGCTQSPFRLDRPLAEAPCPQSETSTRRKPHRLRTLPFCYGLPPIRRHRRKATLSDQGSDHRLCGHPRSIRRLPHRTDFRPAHRQLGKTHKALPKSS